MLQLLHVNLERARNEWKKMSFDTVFSEKNGEKKIDEAGSFSVKCGLMRKPVPFLV